MFLRVPMASRLAGVLGRFELRRRLRWLGSRRGHGGVLEQSCVRGSQGFDHLEPYARTDASTDSGAHSADARTDSSAYACADASADSGADSRTNASADPCADRNANAAADPCADCRCAAARRGTRSYG